MVKPHVLRYWEQEFTQLNPIKRRNRRYYQHQEVILIRRIRELLYDQGFTINGARNHLPSEKNGATFLMADDSPPVSEIALVAVKQEIKDILTLLRGGGV